jgi:hypothetical protein
MTEPSEFLNTLYTQDFLYNNTAEVEISRLRYSVRCKFVQFLSYLTTTYQFNKNVLHLAVNILDKVVKRTLIETLPLDLVIICCFWISAKFEDNVTILAGDLLEYLSINHAVNAINECERSILTIINFKLNVPTLISFLDVHLSLIKTRDPMLFSEYFTPRAQSQLYVLADISLLNPQRVGYRQIEAAILYLTMPDVAYISALTGIDEINFQDSVKILARTNAFLTEKGNFDINKHRTYQTHVIDI